MFIRGQIFLFLTAIFTSIISAQTPPIEPGVSLELAKWRAERYSDVRYKLNLTLEKMSPVLKGSIEIKVTQAAYACAELDCPPLYIVLDWRKIKGHEEKSTISNVFLNGVALSPPSGDADKSVRASYEERDEHLIFHDGVRMGENVIKLDFTSPILTSGSAITRYVDKEDGSEYIYSLFVPSDASTAFPVFDQPDLKARFSLFVTHPKDWSVLTNGSRRRLLISDCFSTPGCPNSSQFYESKPISTYVFAFAAGPWREFVEEPRPKPAESNGLTPRPLIQLPPGISDVDPGHADDAGFRIYVRKSQAAKFKPHAAEVFRLNREAVKYFETYFDYKFPFPKYDLVLIPEFPFGGMEHAGATFLRESSIIFPQEPTKNDYISRATLIFHEAAHQWFGDTVTMRWFDDLWLKEGFATFTAYKAMEKIMPEYNAWKVFYERVKQAAYQTDSTKGTTPIYQEIKNLSAAKSAYGAIVYNKAPAFLRQAEFYLGEEKFQTAVRAFLKKHEFGNAGWEDLVKEFEATSRQDLQQWANAWVRTAGLPTYYAELKDDNSIPNNGYFYSITQVSPNDVKMLWPSRSKRLLKTRSDGRTDDGTSSIDFNEFNKGMNGAGIVCDRCRTFRAVFQFANYQDYGYGIFLLDPKSRDYVLKNIGSEKDDFLRTMMWGALWDSVREGEMDPREYVDLVVKELGKSNAFTRDPSRKNVSGGASITPKDVTLTETDESTIQTLLSRVSTAMRYYIEIKGEPPASAGGQKPGNTSARRKRSASVPNTDRSAAANWPPAHAGGSDRLEALLIDRMQNAPTPGQKITYYRAFLALGSSENARRIMKEILKNGGNPNGSEGVKPAPDSTQRKSAQPATQNTLPTGRVSAPMTTKDKFDIVSRLIILGDPDAPRLLADLERTETSDDAKRYAYAAKAGFATAENKAKFWNDFVNNKEISESWIEAAFGPFNNIRHAELTLPYLERALKELPNHKRNRKIFFVNGWLGAFVGGQKSEQALAIINKFLADNPNLDNDLRLKILENADIIERAVKIRAKY